MNRFILLALMLPLTLSVCSSLCQACSDDSPSPYACSSCFPDNDQPYISSCSSPSQDRNKFLAPVIIIILLHLFLLCMGMGMYRQIFQNIQLATLITWRYNFQRGAIALQATNFAIVTNNSFIATFGFQFIILVMVLIIFLFILAVTDKQIHSPTAILLKRKKITFPIRLVTLFYNVLLLSSLIQVLSINDVAEFSPFSFSISVLALIVSALILIMVGVVSNWKKFQVDDPHYYVLLEQMTSKKWHSKNNILFSLINRTLIICLYVALFSNPAVAGILIIIMQTIYTVYFIALIRFTKLRYFFAKGFSHVFLIGTFTISYVGSAADINSSTWNNCSLTYIIFLMAHVIFFFIISVAEIAFRREQISKYLSSFYQRFIKCEKIDDKIETTKYDESSHREKVKEFHTNLLYQKDISRGPSIEMTAISQI